MEKEILDEHIALIIARLNQIILLLKTNDISLLRGCDEIEKITQSLGRLRGSL